jgi:heme O synthase-like polyprenyltransferase
MGLGLDVLVLEGAWPPVLGAAAILRGNGVYVCLKRVTAFSTVPGAPAGVFPPAAGKGTTGFFKTGG